MFLELEEIILICEGQVYAEGPEMSFVRSLSSPLFSATKINPDAGSQAESLTLPPWMTR